MPTVPNIVNVTSPLYQLHTAMSTSEAFGAGRSDSPDPASHAANVYDQPDGVDEWVDEEDDDFEPTTEGSDDVEFFESAEDPEADFQGR